MVLTHQKKPSYTFLFRKVLRIKNTETFKIFYFR